MEIEDAEAALVNSFFLPGGLLDPEHYDEGDDLAEASRFVFAPSVSVQTRTLPVNPWASDSKPQASITTALEYPSVDHDPAPLIFPLNQRRPTEMFSRTEEALNFEVARSTSYETTVLLSLSQESCQFRPPPGFGTEIAPVTGFLAAIDPRILAPDTEIIHIPTRGMKANTVVKSTEEDDDGDLSQYSIPKELQDKDSIASSASSLSTSTCCKNDAPSTVTAQTEKESFDPEIQPPSSSPDTKQSSILEPKLVSTPKLDKSPPDKSPKSSQPKKNRRPRSHKQRSPLKSLSKALLEETIPLAHMEEPITVEDHEAEATAKSLEAIFSAVVFLCWFSGIILQGVLSILSGLYNSTAPVRRIVAKFSVGVVRTIGTCIANGLSITLLLHGEAIMMILEDFRVALCYIFLYLAPFMFTHLSELLCTPHWLPQMLIFIALWYQCTPLNDEIEKTFVLTKEFFSNAPVKDTKAVNEHATSTPKIETTPQKDQHMKVILLIMTQYVLLGLVCWDGFSTEFGILLDLSTSGRLLLAYTISMLRHGLSSILWMSWAGQFLVVSFCPRSLLLDQLLLVIGLSSIRMDQKLKKLKRE